MPAGGPVGGLPTADPFSGTFGTDVDTGNFGAAFQLALAQNQNSIGMGGNDYLEDLLDPYTLMKSSTDWNTTNIDNYYSALEANQGELQKLSGENTGGSGAVSNNPIAQAYEASQQIGGGEYQGYYNGAGALNYNPTAIAAAEAATPAGSVPYAFGGGLYTPAMTQSSGFGKAITDITDVTTPAVETAIVGGAAAATGGAVSGAIGGLGGSIAGGAAAGVASNVAGAAINNSAITGKGLLESAAVGAISGAAKPVTTALGGEISDVTGLGSGVSNAIAGAGVSGLAGAAKGAITGTGAETGAEEGAVAGAVSGAVQGSGLGGAIKGDLGNTLGSAAIGLGTGALTSLASNSLTNASGKGASATPNAPPSTASAPSKSTATQANTPALQPSTSINPLAYDQFAYNPNATGYGSSFGNVGG